MKIGIIVHSKTGNTLRFARTIGDKISGEGHKVELIELKTSGPVEPGDTHVVITNTPDCRDFDAILLGGPVWGFAASPVILSCIKALKGVSGKRAVPFVTAGFPFRAWGGNQAVAQMGRSLVDAGATLLPGAVIPKMFHDVVKLMDAAASKIAASLK